MFAFFARNPFENIIQEDVYKKNYIKYINTRVLFRKCHEANLKTFLQIHLEIRRSFSSFISNKIIFEKKKWQRNEFIKLKWSINITFKFFLFQSLRSFEWNEYSCRENFRIIKFINSNFRHKIRQIFHIIYRKTLHSISTRNIQLVSNTNCIRERIATT